MVIRDWSAPADYRFCEQLDASQWAWEFLRRNPQYQQEWRAFDAVWQQLEAAYGRPPDRDFCAWRLDPRAWVYAADCAEGDCRVDQDKVLIECALGARWGFHKFPPDPRDDDPVGGQRLVWRAIEQPVPVVGHADTDWLSDDPARIALGFDLALPLREQIERAKRHLQLVQRRRLRSGRIRSRSIESQRRHLTLLLRLLDATAQSADADVLATLDPDWRALLDEAAQLRDGGYRSLALLPP